jgi:uncharacterized protein (UPF0332 family)
MRVPTNHENFSVFWKLRHALCALYYAIFYSKKGVLLLFRQNEFAVSRLSDYLSFLHDHFPSDDRMGYLPF